MQEELETVRKDVAMAEDKLATSLYTVLAQEATCAQNLGDYLHQLKVNDTCLFWVKLCSFSSSSDRLRWGGGAPSTTTTTTTTTTTSAARTRTAPVGI